MMKGAFCLKWSIATLSLALLLAGCGNADEEATETPETPDEEQVEVEENDEQTVEEEAVEETPEPEEEPEEIRVSFYGVGDNLIHSTVYVDALTADGTYDFSPMYRNVAADVQAADLAYINQETIIGGDELGLSHYPAFNTPEGMIPSLVNVGFDLVTGSNNHSLDKGTTGILNTIDLWSQYEDDILFTGVFNSPEHRDMIPVIEKNGLTFSLLAYTYGTNGIAPEYPYLLNYFDPELITADVKRAQEISDFVMVAAHWGDENVFELNAFQLEYAQLFADLGVDVVIGTHSHTIQPLKWVEGEQGNQTLVMYSMGNILSAQIDDFNLLGSAFGFDFVNVGDDYYIEDPYVEPMVTHYTIGTPGVLSTIGNFEIVKWTDFDETYVQQHGLNGIPGKTMTREALDAMVDAVYAEEFLRTD